MARVIGGIAMHLKTLIVTAAAAAALSTAAHAGAYTFSFVSDLGLGDPSIVPGTASGMIYGLSAEGDHQMATRVVITAYAPGVVGLPPVAFDAQSYAEYLALNVDPNIYVSQNDFSVHLGQITSAVYQIFGGYLDLNVGADGFPDGGGYNSLVSPDGQTRVQNLDGFAALHFAAVPEPATWGLMLLGFGGLGAALRTRRREALSLA
jgi:hypothetical protein